MRGAVYWGAVPRAVPRMVPAAGVAGGGLAARALSTATGPRASGFGHFGGDSDGGAEGSARVHPLAIPGNALTRVPIMARVMSLLCSSSMKRLLPPPFWTPGALEAGALAAFRALLADPALKSWSAKPHMFDVEFLSEVVAPGARNETVPPVLLSAPLVEMIRPKVKVRAVGAAFGAADDDGSHTNVWGLRMPTQTIGEFASEHGYAPTTLASVVEECMAEYARFDVLVRIDMPVMLALGGPGIGSFAAEGPDFEAMMREAKSFGPFKVMTAKGMGGSGGLGTRLRHEIVLSLELPADEPKWVVSDVNHALGVFGGYLRSRMNAVEELGAP
ncbi:uncharacterized protein AMSG_01767 [Thecamonas trahens ATCC 50062]|uniref:Uncharacterized protein n=1 Tax=Thecamonas trahens ATCC 50062 TaxID=461836 RepID=A0A0L0DTF3_THETB|nr:hypothetical protein AMSG_01767 [Thecamonas trahens ATCC 50062]KNC55502.1 hypothetical protein AMSG_01767 [Thecamonas trahens ATCC 50062]|eukprot:XP_013761282.1 hypothetical protein AMSG_01767 [Thecamonas trahens ATCC 50062]